MNPKDTPPSGPQLAPGSPTSDHTQLDAIRRAHRDLASRAASFASHYATAQPTLPVALNRATRAEAYLDPFLRSRFYRTAWTLGLAKRPAWLDEYTGRPALPATTLPAPAEIADIANHLSHVTQQLDDEAARRAADAAKTDMDAALQHLAAKGFAPTVILDVGSGKGFWSERAGWLHFPAAHYYMIDPLDESQPHLTELARRFPNYHPLQLAISSTPGQLTLSVTADGDSSSLNGFPNVPAIAHRAVPVETLDRLLADGRIQSPQLAKIDVQGFELEVLRGATQLLGRTDIFIIEVNLFRFTPDCPLAHEVVSFMAEHGYRLFDLAGSLRRPHDNDLGQLDLVFARNDSPLLSSNRWT